MNSSRVLDKISEDYALDERSGIAFVYFNFQDPETQKYDKVLAALVKQLCRRRKAFPNQLREKFELADVPTPQELIAQLIALSDSKTFDQVFLIIDALDECEPRKHILSFIDKLAGGSSCNFKIFVTSRRERDIETTFTRQGFPTLQIQATKVNADIERFVDFEVERRTGEDNFCVINQELKDKIKHALCSQSNGM